MEDAADAAEVASGVSFSYPAPRFLILRIGLLAGHPVTQEELVALEADVQKAARRLESQIESLKLELERERDVKPDAGFYRARAELEVQLSVSQASERVLQQMVDQARSDMLDMRRKLHHTQVALAASQTALTAAADTEAYLRAQLQQLEQLLGQQQQQDLLHQEQNKQQQLQELKQQQAEVLVSTPGTCKPQAPAPSEPPADTADTAADTIRQQDQQDQRTPLSAHQQQRPIAPWHADTVQEGQQSPAAAAARQLEALQLTPTARHVPSPLLSPAPAASAPRRTRIPTPPPPEAPAGPATGSYASALRRSQTGLGAAGASGDGAAAATPGNSSSSSSSMVGLGGSKALAFKFSAPPLQAAAAASRTPFSAPPKPFSAGRAPTTNTTTRFGSSGNGSVSSRRRALRHGAQGTGGSRPKQQLLAQQPVSRAVAEAEGSAEAPEARKRRWR